MPAPDDVAVSFVPTEVDLTLAGHQFTIRAEPAGVWLMRIFSMDLAALLPGMLIPEDQERFDQLLLDGDLDEVNLSQIYCDLIEAASGHRWWWTTKLLSLLRGPQGTEWLGRMARVDASRVPLASWVNSFYAIVVDNIKQEDRVPFDADLDTPPAGVEVELSEADVDASSRAFFEMGGG